ncbi:MAG: toll/interleukin-1 receptor domain-containing protein [Desulfobacteraceae bacterium]|nr:toll/interleukin-1 receptor domain-containing protein [Desulfobacteraceae bacterium]
MPNVFISYTCENIKEVTRLSDDLKAYNINVWLDREQLIPGCRWKDAIRKAISKGDFFIACFSAEYKIRPRTYMNEELTLAIEELRLRPTDRTWFIPVLLSECDIPDRNIGGGETLCSIQWVELYKNWYDGIRRILLVIQPDYEKIDISGLWKSNFGSIRLIQQGDKVTGEYSFDNRDYHSGFLFDGKLSGKILNQKVIFHWKERSGLSGVGYWNINKNGLKGAWWSKAPTYDELIKKILIKYQNYK